MSVDASSLDSLIRNYAQEKATCLAQGFHDKSVEIEAQKHPDGTGAMGDLTIEGPTDTGSSFQIVETCPEEYGGWQNDGTGEILPVNKKALYNAETGWGPYARSAGPPGSHWWDALIDAWGDVVSECGS